MPKIPDDMEACSRRTAKDREEVKDAREVKVRDEQRRRREMSKLRVTGASELFVCRR